MTMRVHRLNCGTMRPRGGRLVSDLVPGLTGARLVSHCLLVETDRHGLVLIDTGTGADPHAVAGVGGALFNLAIRPVYDIAETPTAQVRRLGFDPQDVRHVLMTHLDPDHAGALAEFPWATVHLAQAELDAGTASPHLSRRLREHAYAPAQWAHGPRWSPFADDPNSTWKGVANARTLAGLPDEIVAVALPGHSRGHTGFALDLDGQSGPRWLLHGGDSFFSHRQIESDRDDAPPLIRLFHRLSQFDARDRRRTMAHLRRLEADPQVELVCSHDPRGLRAG